MTRHIAVVAVATLTIAVSLTGCSGGGDETTTASYSIRSQWYGGELAGWQPAMIDSSGVLYGPEGEWEFRLITNGGDDTNSGVDASETIVVSRISSGKTIPRTRKDWILDFGDYIVKVKAGKKVVALTTIKVIPGKG